MVLVVVTFTHTHINFYYGVQLHQTKIAGYVCIFQFSTQQKSEKYLLSRLLFLGVRCVVVVSSPVHRTTLLHPTTHTQPPS